MQFGSFSMATADCTSSNVFRPFAMPTQSFNEFGKQQKGQQKTSALVAVFNLFHPNLLVFSFFQWLTTSKNYKNNFVIFFLHENAYIYCE